MSEKKFDPHKLHVLNDPNRLKDIPPDYIWNKLSLDKPEVLVDIGAGTGFFSVHFLQYAKGAKIYACDTSEVMLEWMQENICPQYPDILPTKMQEKEVPLEDGIADLVYMLNLHHELDDPRAVLRETHRILKNKGIIFIVDWKKEDMSEGPPTNIRYLPEQIIKQLQETYFKNINVFREMPKHYLIVAQKETKL